MSYLMKNTQKNKNTPTPLLAQYFSIREEYPDYLLFFRLGDFYELFFDDAVCASETLGIALTHRGQYDGKDVPMCGVPFHASDNYLSKLVHQGYKVAICEQTEDPKEAKKRGTKSVVNREVVRLVTAGTLTEDPLLSSKNNNFLLSFNKKDNNFGCAWLDISTGEFFTQCFNLSKEDELTVINTLLAKTNPAELIVCDEYAHNKNIYEILQKSPKQLTILPQERFNSQNAKIRLQNIYNVETLSSFGDFEPIEIGVAGALLDYVEISQKGKLPLLQNIVKMTHSDVVEIDNATRRSLEISSSFNTNNGHTLLKSIDKTITSAGGRMLNNRLSNPLKDITTINMRLDMVDFFVKCTPARKEIRNLLRCVSDMERALSRVMLGRCSPKDILNIKNTLEIIPQIRNAIHFKSNTPSFEIGIPPILQQVMEELGNHNNLASRLDEALKKEDLPLLARDGNFIKEGYSPDLDNARNLKNNGHNLILSLQEKYIKNTGISQLKLKFNNVIGYFIEVPIKLSEQLINNPDFIFRQSVLNASRYTTVELTELEDKVRSASDKALAIELEVYEDLLKYVKASAELIIKTSQAFAKIDVAAALAEIACEYNYCRPILDNSKDFIIKGGRHPVVEQSILSCGSGEFIANDCTLDNKMGNLWLLTGPNMAGKSTYLRQNAIIAIMAQMGSFVPADEARIGIIDKIFSRVGASDDLAKGQSTFMVEMVETASILNQATENSFVILDEIGRGTATFDGLSIAWAVVEHLHEINRCRTIFATHYHELTALNNKLKNLSLHCMRVKEFNNEVIFLHEITTGAANRSYGIHVAQIAGLPQKVISRAEEVLHNLENQNKGLSKDDLSQQLPLFTYAKESKPQTSKLHETLKDLNPDDLSPREALAKLYELKKLL